MVAERVFGDGHGRERVARRGIELDKAQLRALGKLEGLGVLVVPLLEPGVVELHGVCLLLVLLEAGDAHGVGVGHVGYRLLDLHRRGPRSRAGKHGARDLHRRETALEKLLEALGRKAVLAQERLVHGEAELAVLLERPVVADCLRDLGIGRLDAVAAGDFEKRRRLPRLAVHLGVAAAPVAVLSEPAGILGNGAELGRIDRLAAESAYARIICLALAVPQKIVYKKVEGERTADDYRENTPKPLVANELVELQDYHFTL